MVCNLNRSILTGLLTTLVMTLIIFLWIGPNKMQALNINTSILLLLMSVLFVISVSIDVFNQCYTVCNSVTSSLAYGAFTTGLIYLFYSLFVNTIDINMHSGLLFLINAIILAGLHSLTCKSIH